MRTHMKFYNRGGDLLKEMTTEAVIPTDLRWVTDADTGQIYEVTNKGVTVCFQKGTVERIDYMLHKHELTPDPRYPLHTEQDHQMHTSEGFLLGDVEEEEPGQ